nr:family 16 glycoside hydrolase [Allomuricauda sp.]
MKKTSLKITTLLFALFALQTMMGQINRTLETKVADILAQLPTKDLGHSDKLMQEIMDLETEGILKFCDMLVPLGTGDDTKARYAIQSLAIYAGRQKNKIKNNAVEDALLIGLKKASNPEIKTFLIDRLMYCGSNTSIEPLGVYLKGDEIWAPALATITAIGTKEAASSIYNLAKSANGKKRVAIIEALGIMRFEPALTILEKEASNPVSNVSKQKSLMALAEIAHHSSYDILSQAVIGSVYQMDDSGAIVAYIHYGNRLLEKGNSTLALIVANSLLKNCKSDDQLHYRAAGFGLLCGVQGKNAVKIHLKEARHKDLKYRGAVLAVAAQNLTNEEVLKWVKAYKKADASAKPQIIGLLSKRDENEVFDKCIVSAVNAEDEMVRLAGIKALAFQKKNKALPVLMRALEKDESPSIQKAIEKTLLRLVGKEDSTVLAEHLSRVNDKGKEVLVNVLAARNATTQFDLVAGLVNNANPDLKNAAYRALPSIASIDELQKLINILSKTKEKWESNSVQSAIINVLDSTEKDNSEIIYEAYKSFEDKSKLLPVLPTLSTDIALKMVLERLPSENMNERIDAIRALAKWKTKDALPHLFHSVVNSKNQIRSEAFGLYLRKITTSDLPDDQKLLLIRKLTPYSYTTEEKKQIIRAARSAKTFLSLVFVSDFLDDNELKTTASNAIISLALPSPGLNNGLSGDIVRKAVSKSIVNLSGPDSQYMRIDVKEFLDNMPEEKGFVSIFNGKDLTGWEGLVENPIARRKMSKGILQKAQKKANTQMLSDWFVKDGIIGFKGDGYNNICTIKDYGDFEMLVDWKITSGGDSGIYLRGTPQVQIWDIARTDVGAQVGSGGLYNNQKNTSKPLVLADNPINEWNTFRIKMVGERVTVHLNGILVTDNVVLENYWNREDAIFNKEAIELQAHGEDLGFRNIYVREINSGDALLSEEERKEGFKSLFNGKDLDHWIGNKTDYLVENNELAVRPQRGGHGNLYTANEYSDFIFRFDFKLTPGANNGLGIHAPLEGDAAYVGKELQILDNTAPIYTNLKPYQYHGSVYGIIAAKRGFLKPVGEWNSEEVIVKGDHIKITLNGHVIVDGNMKEAAKNGTADQQNHPGLQRNKGHIGFLGHGSELWFRNIRIKELKK